MQRTVLQLGGSLLKLLLRVALSLLRPCLLLVATVLLLLLLRLLVPPVCQWLLLVVTQVVAEVGTRP